MVAGEPGFPGEELLDGGLFEIALLGDEPVQPQGPLEVCPSSPRRALISALLCDGTALHSWHPRPKPPLLQLI